jgi:hypothetical protein
MTGEQVPKSVESEGGDKQNSPSKLNGVSTGHPIGYPVESSLRARAHQSHNFFLDIPVLTIG